MIVIVAHDCLFTKFGKERKWQSLEWYTAKKKGCHEQKCLFDKSHVQKIM
jgi:hypothetical protein